MVLMRIVSLIFVFSICFFNSVIRADPPIPISTYCAVENRILALLAQGVLPEEICVLSDFHGVMTNEPNPSDDSTRNEDCFQVSDRLHQVNVATVVGTAWDKFEEVIGDTVKLQTAELLSVNPQRLAPLQNYLLGPDKNVKVFGYDNGRVAALKYGHIEGEGEEQQAHLKEFLRKKRDRFFRQKIFIPEVIFTGQQFKHIICVDDALDNLKIIEKDFAKTVHAGHAQLTLLHLRKVPPFVRQLAVSREEPKVLVQTGATIPCVRLDLSSSDESDDLGLNAALTQKLQNLMDKKEDLSRSGSDREGLKASRSGRSSMKSSGDDTILLKSSR